MPGAFIMRFENDKVVEVWNVFDPAAVLTQLGLMPGEPATFTMPEAAEYVTGEQDAALVAKFEADIEAMTPATFEAKMKETAAEDMLAQLGVYPGGAAPKGETPVEKTGIEICDKYVVAMQACLGGMPEEARRLDRGLRPDAEGLEGCPCQGRRHDPVGDREGLPGRVGHREELRGHRVPNGEVGVKPLRQPPGCHAVT